MNRTRLAATLLCLVVVVCSVGCPGSQIDLRRLYVANMSDDNMTCLYVRPDGSETWGTNLLASPVPDGEASVQHFSEGPWQIRIVTDRPGDTSAVELYDVTIPDSHTLVVYLLAGDAPMANPADPHWAEGLYAETEVWDTELFFALMGLSF